MSWRGGVRPREIDLWLSRGKIWSWGRRFRNWGRRWRKFRGWRISLGRGVLMRRWGY